MLPVCRTRRAAAFTLVELLAVMAILLVLSGISFGLVRGVKNRAKIQQARSELAILVTALEDYRRFYGDYPQTGPSAATSQRVTLSATGVSAGPGANTAQAVLLNSLIGAYGPTGALGGRLNGPMLVDVARLTLEVPFSTTGAVTTNNPVTFAVATGTPPAKAIQNNSFLDPWGNRYLYFYKRATAALPPGLPSRPTANPWTPPTYVLYSCGPDGASTTLPGATGVFSGTTQTTGDNADNIYADKLP